MDGGYLETLLVLIKYESSDCQNGFLETLCMAFAVSMTVKKQDINFLAR